MEDAVHEGVRRAYLDPDNKLRASVLDESDFGRKNTKDNTPAVISVQMVPGDKLAIDVAAKGGAWAAFLNSGQVCTSAERFYVLDDVYDDFAGPPLRLDRG